MKRTLFHDMAYLFIPVTHVPYLPMHGGLCDILLNDLTCEAV